MLSPIPDDLPRPAPAAAERTTDAPEVIDVDPDDPILLRDVTGDRADDANRGADDERDVAGAQRTTRPYDIVLADEGTD